MTIFDCDAAYGRGAIALPREIETAEALAAELEHAGIGEALVWHRDVWERDFQLGNERMEELRSHQGLHPTLAFVPTCCEEMPDAEAFVQRVRAAGALAVRAFPVHHHFLLDPLACGDLFEAFIAHALPVILPLPEIPGGWDGVYRLLRDFPRLTLILTESGCWGEDRYFRPLMKRYPSFFLATNRLETAGQIESIVERLGADHLVFGSGLPRNYPGGYVMMLQRAAIPDDARGAIAHGNIERILGR